MNNYGQHLFQRDRDWQDLILWRQCIEVDCGWVKALDQQFDPRLDGSDHSLLNPWVDVGLVLLVDFGLGVGLGLVVGESGSLRDTERANNRLSLPCEALVCQHQLLDMTILQLCKDTLALLPSEAKDLSVSPPSGALISALSNAWTLHTSHCHHVHAKSVTLVLDNHSKGPEALHHFLKDDWDMPKVGISQDLTWQHLEKKLTKSFRLEIPDFGSSNLNQSEKETHSPTPKPNPHPCAI
ncbi:hypothetical protein PPACK8108_LOCUS14619 [Phakopsora pachyrhizi]|uniref:Uncharacterized protein n=1 Tax=Phakopsora pachyrhizi TaxID=170000 RepID=A0AAV0BA67_PHAPC|nr:hypothetical protein PPACK8108_LOCUS14619 [Phakopsora pachyrhizi]